MANISLEEEVNTDMYMIKRLTNISLFCKICNTEFNEWQNDDQKAVKMHNHQEKHRKRQPAMLSKLEEAKAQLEHKQQLSEFRKKLKSDEKRFTKIRASMDYELRLKRNISQVESQLRHWGSIPAIPRYSQAYHRSQEYGDLNESDPTVIITELQARQEIS